MLDAGVLGRECVADVVHTLRESVVRVKLQAAGEALAERGLPSVVVRIAAVCTEADVAVGRIDLAVAKTARIASVVAGASRRITARRWRITSCLPVKVCPAFNVGQLMTEGSHIVRLQDHIFTDLILETEVYLLVIRSDQVLVHRADRGSKSGSREGRCAREGILVEGRCLARPDARKSKGGRS